LRLSWEEDQAMQRMDTRSTFRSNHARIALIVVVLATMGIAAASASAYIYVAGPITSPIRGPSTIERLTLDGSAVQPNYIDGPRVEGTNQIQVDGDRIYWVDASVGYRCFAKSASLTGEDVRTLATLSSTEPDPSDELPNGPGCAGISIALAGDHLYWGGDVFGRIGRVSTQPPYDVDPDFIRLPPLGPGATRPDEHGSAFFLVTDGTWLYWYDYSRRAIGRASLDGTDVEPSLFQPEPTSGGHVGESVSLLGASQGYLWWKSDYGEGSLGRARVDGTDTQPDFFTGFRADAGAVTDGSLYYTGSPTSATVDGSVRRIALDPGATPELIAQGLGDGVGYAIAVDSLGALFPEVRITTHDNGTATAAVSTLRPAKVSVRGDRIVPAEATRARNKVARIAIRPRHKTKRSLRRHGSAHVRVRLRYRPQGGLPRSQARALTLRLDRRG
jgi:hypothetical protein